MEKMYKEYRDVAEFRMVYIREAHALDSNRPSRPARENKINQPDNFKDRCTTAQMLMDDESLTIPCLIDSMDNKTDKAYSAKPDRAFLVGTDGKLAVAGARGPRGFGPALDDIEQWLEKLRKSESKSNDSKEHADEAKENADESKEHANESKEHDDKAKEHAGESKTEEHGSKSKEHAGGSKKKTETSK